MMVFFSWVLSSGDPREQSEEALTAAEQAGSMEPVPCMEHIPSPWCRNRTTPNTL